MYTNRKSYFADVKIREYSGGCFMKESTFKNVIMRKPGGISLTEKKV